MKYTECDCKTKRHKMWCPKNPEWESLPDETLTAWIIRQVDRTTRFWSDETWEILGIARDLQDGAQREIKKISFVSKQREVIK